MMKKTCFLFLLLLCGVVAIAQDFEIVSVESLPADMSAREEMKTDHNDRQCALLRVATQNIEPNQREGFSFVPDLGSEVVERATRDGEIWLWVSPGIKYLRIKHRDWGQYELRLQDYVTRVEALHTYKITIRGTLSLALQEQGNNMPTQQYLAFSISPANATLFVNDELWEVSSDGSAVRFVNFGTYNYRVMASNYITQTGTVTVDDPENTQTVPVNLKPDFIVVTLKVDADAEIWVNNEKKGIRSWTGNLGKGNYKIECKQAGHETSMITKEITADMNRQTIDLPKPTPVYGSLNIESTPNFATIYIDGEMVGETPKFIKEILVGRHEVKLVKDEHSDYLETVTINKGEQKTVQATLSKGQTMPIVQAQPSSKENVPEGAINGLFSVGPTKKVYFSKGNLQYQTSTRTWRFAEHQWDIIGDDNKNISSSYNGWIDLFGWGASGYNDKYPYILSAESDIFGYGSTDIAGTNYDWGVYNTISNGGGKGWRTLTKDEWEYVFETRSTNNHMRYAKAIVDGVKGLILLPDNWKRSYYSLSRTDDIEASFNINSISQSDWETKLELNGAVFLPAAGYRDGTSVKGIGSCGYYWSASYNDSSNAYDVSFLSSYLNTGYYCNRYYGLSVRLVYPAEN